MTQQKVESQLAEIYFDPRWSGPHGIGKFLKNIAERIPMKPLDLQGRSTAVTGPWRIARAMRATQTLDLFYSPGYMPPWPRPEKPYVLTLHDLNHVDLPYNSGAAKRLFYSKLLLPACRSAAAIVTVSEFSRGRIIDWSGIAPERVVNVGNAVGLAFSPDGQARRGDPPYFLVVGLRKRHKNQEGVVRAFARSTLRNSHKIVFTGRRSGELTAEIERAGVGGRVEFLEEVSETRLIDLYRGATALVFPSFYEGFGMPVLEAMACGCPVITSTMTALPAVSGHAALLLDPADDAAIADAMERVAEDAELRRRLIEAGLVRARLFRWQDVCEKLLQVFAGVLPPGLKIERR